MNYTISLLCLIFFLSFQNLNAQNYVSKNLESRIDTVFSYLSQEWPNEKFYYNFLYEEPYLIWHGFATKDLYVYNPDSGKLRTINQNNGRGPLEINRITAATTLEHNVYQFDNKFKFIKVSLDKNNFGERGEVYFKNLEPNGPTLYKNHSMAVVQIESAVSKEENIYFNELVFPNNNLVLKLNLVNNTITNLDLGNMSIKENFPNPFFKEGELTISGHHLIYSFNYQPLLYIFDLNSDKLVKQVQIGEMDVEERSTQSAEGRQVALPPKSNSHQKDVINIPGVKNHVLLLRKGKENGISFSEKSIYEYNYMTGKLKREFKLGFIPRELVWAGIDFYMYSHKNFVLYKIENFLTRFGN